MLGLARIVDGIFKLQHFVVVAKSVCRRPENPMTALVAVAGREFGTALDFSAMLSQALGQIVRDPRVGQGTLVRPNAVDKIKDVVVFRHIVLLFLRPGSTANGAGITGLNLYERNLGFFAVRERSIHLA